MASSPRGSDRRCNAIFTCFCKCYLFLFPILCERTLVKCHCSVFIELASSKIGQRAKRVQNSTSVPNSASVPNLDDASGHKAIKIKKLRNYFKLNSIKAKLQQTTAVAIYRPATHTRVKAAKNTRYNPQFVAQHEKICCVTSCKFDDKRGTKPK